MSQERVDVAQYIPLLEKMKANAKARKEVSCLQQEPSVRSKLKGKVKPE